MAEKAYTIQEYESYIHITYHKKVNKSVILDLLDEVDQLHSKKNRLYSHELGINASVEEMRSLSERGKTSSAKVSKLAFYTKDTCTFGLLRAYEVFREGAVTQTRVFQSEEEAIQWLSEDTNKSS